jgi:hypothetical protein
VQIRISGPESGQESERDEKSIRDKRQFWTEIVIGSLVEKDMIISRGMLANGENKVKNKYKIEISSRFFHRRSQTQWERAVMTTDTEEEKKRIWILRSAKYESEETPLNVGSSSRLSKVERRRLVRQKVGQNLVESAWSEPWKVEKTSLVGQVAG